MSDERIVYPCPLCGHSAVDIIEISVVNDHKYLVEAKCPGCKAYGSCRQDANGRNLPGMRWRVSRE